MAAQDRHYWLYALIAILAVIVASQLAVLHNLHLVGTLIGFVVFGLILLWMDRIALARRWNGLARAGLAVALAVLLLSCKHGVYVDPLRQSTHSLL